MKNENPALEKYAELMIEKMKEVHSSNWTKPWFTSRFKGFPQNLTGRSYNNQNKVLLYFICDKYKYKTPIFVTFNQARNEKIQVLKGAKAFPISYYDLIIKDKITGKRITREFYKDLSHAEQEKYKVIPFLKYYNVFNLDQTEPNIKIEESGIQQENGHKQVNTRINYSNKPQDNYNIEELSNKEVIGTISYYDFNGKVCEVIEYNTVESYLKSINDELNSNPNGFKYETLTTDANIKKSVDDIVYGAYGEDNPHPLEWYSSNNTKATISPEQYLSEERNKIMREHAKNPFGALDKENISAEGMDKWATVTNKYMEMKTNISTKQIELQSSGCKTLICDVSHSSGPKESSHYRILDKSTGKTESINVGDIDLGKQSPETLKKLLSGQQTEMANKSGTNSLVTLNKTITGWGISAVKQVFNSADNSAGI